MTCDGCVKDVSDSLYKVKGISKVDAQLKEQLVSIEGTGQSWMELTDQEYGLRLLYSAPPSAIVQAIQDTGRDAILRGSGSTNGAAVSILETFHRGNKTNGNGLSVRDMDGSSRLVHGLARLVEVSPTATLVDLTIRGLPPGDYIVSIREYGDVKDGAASTGPVWDGQATATGDLAKAADPRGAICRLSVDSDGRGSAFIDRPFQVWEVVGHALVVSKSDESQGRSLTNDENTVVGVIARSAGVWDNDKTVCSCTGKTLWEERKEVRQNGFP
jgi:copper chaperone for superoxide dismutase